MGTMPATLNDALDRVCITAAFGGGGGMKVGIALFPARRRVRAGCPRTIAEGMDAETVSRCRPSRRRAAGSRRPNRAGCPKKIVRRHGCRSPLYEG